MKTKLTEGGGGGGGDGGETETGFPGINFGSFR